MRPSSQWRLFVCVVLFAALTGCTLGTPKQAATPPPPKPVAAPPAPEPQLSIPQTAVVLPSPQPVNPDAIPAAPVAQPPAPDKSENAAATPPPRPPRRTPAVAGPPKAETEAEADAPPPAPAEEQPRIQPILSEDAQRRIKAAIETRKKEVRDLLARARAHPSSTNQGLMDRINSFDSQSDEAAKRGDYTQADSLSQRALILAKELQVE